MALGGSIFGWPHFSRLQWGLCPIYAFPAITARLQVSGITNLHRTCGPEKGQKLRIERCDHPLPCRWLPSSMSAGFGGAIPLRWRQMVMGLGKP